MDKQILNIISISIAIVGGRGVGGGRGGYTISPPFVDKSNDFLWTFTLVLL